MGAAAAALAGEIPSSALPISVVSAPAAPLAQPISEPLAEFDYSAVELTGGPLKRQYDRIHAAYLALDNDRLLRVYRERAGLPAPPRFRRRPCRRPRETAVKQVDELVGGLHQGPVEESNEDGIPLVGWDP